MSLLSLKTRAASLIGRWRDTTATVLSFRTGAASDLVKEPEGPRYTLRSGDLSPKQLERLRRSSFAFRQHEFAARRAASHAAQVRQKMGVV